MFNNKRELTSIILFLILFLLTLPFTYSTDLRYIDKISPRTGYPINITGDVIIGGNVGIGTSSPGVTLDIVSSTPALRLTNSLGGNPVESGKIIFGELPGDNSVTLRYDGSLNKLILDSSYVSNIIVFDRGTGNIGIGTTGPVQKLDVRGNVYVSGSVGIGTTSPSYKLDVSGTARITGATYLENSKCPSGQVLTADTSTGLVSCTDISGVGGVTGTGTANYIAKWNGTSSITNSVIYESGGNVGIGTTSPSYKLDVNGQVRIQTLNAGSTNTVVTHSSGVLQTRTIDSRVWGSSLVDYSGTSANYIPKMSDTNTITNSVIYESGGNVGIGTTSPSGKLDVRGDEVRIWSGTGSVNYATGAGDLYVQDTAEVDGDLRVGGTIYGDGSGITNLPSASVQDVWVNESGDTMTGDLDMNSNDILNVNVLHAKSLGVADTYTNAVNNLPAGNSLYVQDDIKVGGNIQGNSGDVAENVHIKGDLEPGDVVVISEDGILTVEKSTKPYDTSVAGVISTDPAYILAIDREGLPLALSGIVPVKVTNESGNIKPKDLLTTSSKPGYAMKCADLEKCKGAILGKAMGYLNESEGIIQALVMLG